MSIKHYATASFIAMAIAISTSCSHQNDGNHDHASGHSEQEHNNEHGNDTHSHSTNEHNATDTHDEEIVVEPDDAKRFGIKTQTISLQPFNDAIRVSGKIINSSSDIATVSSPTPGIVTLYSNITEGATIKRGQSIANVSSSNISGGDPNAAARVTLNAAKKELDRLTPLLEDGIVTRKEYNAALAAYESAKAAYSSSASSGRCTSPIAGVITGLSVKTGDYVEAGTPIATISKNATLTLRADLPEKYRQILHEIDGASVRAPYTDSWISLDSLNGKRVDSPNIAASAGYIPVYFTFDNDGSLSAGGFVEIYLIGANVEDVIAIPTKAIVEQQGNYFAYVKTSDHGYEKRKIHLGITNGTHTRIESGLNVGDNVVVEGAMMVKLAEISGAVPPGHSHNH
mgnify:CR=1 FL=1